MDILSLGFGITEKSLPVNPVYRPTLSAASPSIAPQRLGMGVLPVDTEVSSW